MSIRIKLLIILLIPTLSIGIALMVAVNYNASQALSKDNNEKMKELLHAYATTLNADLGNTERDVASIGTYLNSSYLPQIQTTDDLTQQNMIYQQLVDFVQAISNANKDKNYFVYFTDNAPVGGESFGFGDYSGDSRPDPMPQLSKNYFSTNTLSADKAWYFGAFQNSEPRWYGPLVKYEGVKERELMVYSMPIYYGDQLVAVIGADYSISKLKRFLANIHYHQTGYAALIDANQKIISHPIMVAGFSVSEQFGQSYQFMDDILKRQGSGVIHYVWTDQRQKILCFTSLQNGWKLVLTAYVDEVLTPALMLNHQITLMFFIAIAVTGLLTYITAVFITRPVMLLSQEMTELMNSQTAGEFSHLLLSRNDQIGQLTRALAQHYNRYLATMDELKFLSAHLSQEIDNRNISLIEVNRELALKQSQVSKQQAVLQLQNSQLESSIQTLSKTQHMLIAQEKLANFGEIIHSIALEIEPPLQQAKVINQSLDFDFAKITRSVLKSDFSKRQFLEVYHHAHMQNKKLIGLLLFIKDIIDYIKDLTAAKTFKQSSIIELNDYLEKAIANLHHVPFDRKPLISLERGDQYFLEVDAPKFVHLISSLLIHIASSVQLADKPLHIRLKPVVQGYDLKLLIYDNSFGTADSETFKTSAIDADSKVYMGLQMIRILTKESFGGTLTISRSTLGAGCRYELQFPKLIYTEPINP